MFNDQIWWYPNLGLSSDWKYSVIVMSKGFGARV